MVELADRIAMLEERLLAAEDELAIIRLIASYGPLIDSGSTDRGPALFDTEGVYDVNFGRMTGPDEFSELLRGAGHQRLIGQGVVHAMGLPWVRVNGNEAIAINCTQMFIKEGGGYPTLRAAHNVWKLAKSPDGGWMIRERTNRLIGEDGKARNLLLASI